jgi:hypothetical protein
MGSNHKILNELNSENSAFKNRTVSLLGVGKVNIRGQQQEAGMPILTAGGGGMQTSFM